MTGFWAAFAGAVAALAVAAAAVAVVATVRQHNRALADLRKVTHRYRIPSPWWKRWYQRTEEWDEFATPKQVRRR